ncbi:MAG TPA: M23 family metallopeptidase [Acidimicrobiia bacterium]|nr:M23 family metallopeptidase [Acidimicrobiia bacterium]
MHSRVVKRVGTSIISVTLVLGGLLPELPALASSGEPPFEIVFPQEVSATHFSSTYGARRSGGRRHRGNDLLAPRMTEVYAIADGVVVHVGINRLSGRNVRILHEGDWTSYYLHLNNDTPGSDDGSAPWTFTVAPGIEVGAGVDAGQLIGWSGDSGNAEGTTPHTHFELHSDDRAIDPFDLLSEAQQRALAHEAWLTRAVVRDLPDYPID